MAPLSNVRLHDPDTNQPIGEITEDELQFLFDQLELESDDDEDFYIDAATIEMLEDAKAPAHLLEVLRQAIGGKEGVEISWAKTDGN
jgi:processive 1,2-diacylglycerol beta-glucosyltransferase